MSSHAPSWPGLSPRSPGSPWGFADSSSSGEDVPADGSAVNVGAAPFSVPFVLPSGDTCDNFDQLALALHADPAMALGLLRVGDLEAFLRAQGRADIAAAIRVALRASNSER